MPTLVLNNRRKRLSIKSTSSKRIWQGVLYAQRKQRRKGSTPLPKPTSIPVLSGTAFNPQDSIQDIHYRYDASICFSQDHDVYPYSYVIIGVLPDGLELDLKTGMIDGFPTTPGDYTGLDITAINKLGQVSTTNSANIVIT